MQKNLEYVLVLNQIMMEVCCIVAKGSMYGNVCRTYDWNYVENYEKCCNKINGKVKCKPGYTN